MIAMTLILVGMYVAYRLEEKKDSVELWWFKDGLKELEKKKDRDSFKKWKRRSFGRGTENVP
jgi:hypothetical protein